MEDNETKNITAYVNTISNVSTGHGIGSGTGIEKDP
jgi:hypothetical protein